MNVDFMLVNQTIKKCYNNFKDIWIGYDNDLRKLSIVCAVQVPDFHEEFYNNLKTKISVNIAREYGTRFVEELCDIVIINYL